MIPLYYENTTVANNIIVPATYKGESSAKNFYCRYLRQKILSLYEWSGIPEYWDKDYFLYSLYQWGYVGVISTPDYGVIPQHGFVSGRGIFYQPIKFSIGNPLINQHEYSIGKECELIRISPDWAGLFDICDAYGELMAVATGTIVSNLFNSRLSYVLSAPNKATGETLKKMFDQISRGEPAVVVDSKATKLADGSDAWGVFSQASGANYIGDTLLQDLVRIEAQFDMEIGLKNSNTEKKAQMIEAEVNANNDSTLAKCDLWLDHINTSLGKVNAMFGLGVSCRKRYDGGELLGRDTNSERAF